MDFCWGVNGFGMLLEEMREDRGRGMRCLGGCLFWERTSCEGRTGRKKKVGRLGHRVSVIGYFNKRLGSARKFASRRHSIALTYSYVNDTLYGSSRHELDWVGICTITSKLMIPER